MVRLLRGSKIYVLDMGTEEDEDCLSLTTEGIVITIPKNELEEIGFN